MAKTQDIKTLVQKVYHTYRSLADYSDKGQFHLELRRDGEDHRSESVGVFSTKFDRVNDKYFFNLEMITSSPYYEKKINIERGVRKDLASFRVFFNETLFENDTVPLDLALAKGTGISHGLTSFIPRLLMPEEIRGRKLFEGCEQIEWLEQEKLGEIGCYKMKIVFKTAHGQYPSLTASNPLGRKLTEKSVREYVIWIDQESYLIKRLKKIVYLNGSTSTMIVTFEPST